MSEKKIKVLILAKDVVKYKKAANFLSRRGWPSEALGSVKEAIEYVVKNRPDFVVLSYSHPNAGILKLPNLFSQTFNTTSIPFAELANAETMQRMKNCNLEHVFSEAMSGPSIHMRINKILLERDTKTTSKEKKSNSKEKVQTNFSPKVRMSGSETADKPSGMAYMPGREKNTLANGKSDVRRGMLNIHSEDKKTKEPKSLGVSSGPTGAQKGKFNINDSEITSKIGALTKALEKGFKKICHSSSKNPEKLEEIGKIDVMKVNGSEFNGFVIIARPCIEKINHEVVADIRISFAKVLKDENVDVKLGGEFSTEIDRVSFLDWAEEEADFFCLNQYKNSEIGMAFFSADYIPELKASKEVKGMFLAKLKDLTSEQLITFSGYLNLKQNNKMLLYMKKGRKISQSQKDRLLRREVRNIYIPTEDKEKFAHHVVSVILNQSIQDFLNRSKKIFKRPA